MDIKDLMKDITYEEFVEMKKKMDEAEEDTTPYAITDGDEISVVGDPNKTEIKKNDYVILFAYPQKPQSRNTELHRSRKEIQRRLGSTESLHRSSDRIRRTVSVLQCNYGRRFYP